MAEKLTDITAPKYRCTHGHMRLAAAIDAIKAKG